MPLTPADIARKEFFRASDGYDRAEVRAYLEMVAADQRALIERLESLPAPTDGAGEIGSEIAAVLEQARELADRMTQEAHEKAVAERERAEEESHLVRSATSEAAEKLRQEAEDYAYEVRAASERAAREQQLQAADRVGRLLAGESSVRERLYALEITLQGMRGELKEATETVLPELSSVPPPLPPTFEPSAKVRTEESPSVIDLREDDVVGSSNGNLGQ